MDDEVVSLGLVVPTAEFQAQKKTREDFFRSYLPEINPELKRRTQDIEFVEDVHVIPNYSYQVRGFCGKGFICIGDAHRFIDPIFSFGLSATVREAEFATPHVIAYLNGQNRDAANPFEAHQRFVEKGTDNLEDMVDLFWEQPFAFATFVHFRYREEVTDAFRRTSLRERAPTFICYPAVPQIAPESSRLHTRGRLFHSHRLALPSGARAVMGAGFTGRDD